MTVNNPIDRSKLGQAKRHILTDKKGIPLSTITTSASTHDIKVVTGVLDNAVVLKRPTESSFIKKKRKMVHYHLVFG